MAFMKLRGSYGSVQQVEYGKSKKDSEKIKNKAKNKNKNKNESSTYMPKLGCFISESEQDGGLEMEVEIGESRAPDHLVVMVNGIIGSAANWRYASKQFLKSYSQNLIVHCSKCNANKLTFDGVDEMGKRLAEEVLSVIKSYPDLKKISFIGHSLGGLVARYAIAMLYGRDPTRELSKKNEDCSGGGSGDACMKETFKGKIAGLEPINFITCATPHLGSRPHNQVPVLCGFSALEKAACYATKANAFGRSVKHLFWTDEDGGKPPLLLQMVDDCEDLPFISALQSFRHRVAYGNACGDHLVGWRTSSIRRQNELPKRENFVRNERYPHIVNVEAATTPSPQEVPLDTKTNGYRSNPIEMEEKMIRALTKMSWVRIDVCFSGIKQKVLGHSSIQVKNYWINYEGADVVQHMIDHFRL